MNCLAKLAAQEQALVAAIDAATATVAQVGTPPASPSPAWRQPSTPPRCGWPISVSNSRTECRPSRWPTRRPLP